MHILGISGSLRKDSFNTAALRACTELLPPGGLSAGRLLIYLLYKVSLRRGQKADFPAFFAFSVIFSGKGMRGASFGRFHPYIFILFSPLHLDFLSGLCYYHCVSFL